MRDPAPWPNTTLLAGNASDAVSALKKQPDHDLVIMGSGQLIQSLMTHDLIDEYMLIVHPRLLGAGRRLFPEGTPPTSLHLLSATPTSTGAVVAVYQPRS